MQLVPAEAVEREDVRDVIEVFPQVANEVTDEGDSEAPAAAVFKGLAERVGLTGAGAGDYQLLVGVSLDDRARRCGSLLGDVVVRICRHRTPPTQTMSFLTAVAQPLTDLERSVSLLRQTSAPAGPRPSSGSAADFRRSCEAWLTARSRCMSGTTVTSGGFPRRPRKLWTSPLLDLAVDAAAPILDAASWRGVPDDSPPRWSERSTAILALGAIALRGTRTVALTVRAGYSAEALSDLRRLNEAAGHAREVALDVSGNMPELAPWTWQSATRALRILVW